MNDMKIAALKEPLGFALKAKGGDKEDGNKFASALIDSLGELNGYQQDASKAVENLITGKSKNIHETMMAISKAEIAFKLTMQVRNKMLEAYKEVMNTAV